MLKRKIRKVYKDEFGKIAINKTKHNGTGTAIYQYKDAVMEFTWEDDASYWNPIREIGKVSELEIIKSYRKCYK